MSSSVRDRLERHGLAAKKSWGQNFLLEARAYRAIISAAQVDPGQWIVEIGAGLGTLTERLADAAGRVIALERDRDMIAVLQAELSGRSNIEIAEANALTFDYAAIAARAGHLPVVVGNLPYHIASPILFRLLDARAALKRLVLMVQKEMADRIVAHAGTPEYGALSVMVQMLGVPALVCRVSPGAFLPPPKVSSAVLRIELAAGTRVPVQDWNLFRALVRAAFAQRRKMLRNALRALGPTEQIDAALRAAAIRGEARGETLDVAAFARLADALFDTGLRADAPAAQHENPR